jgi:hypothetical protein
VYLALVKESKSTVMLCALKYFDCFVFRHFISHFSDERLTSEGYPYQSIILRHFFHSWKMHVNNRSLIEILALQNADGRQPRPRPSNN